MDGEGVFELLEEEISQDELDDIKPELQAFVLSGRYQLPPHVTPSIYPPPLLLDPAYAFNEAHSPTSSAPHTRRREVPTFYNPIPPPSLDWIPFFQRHIVLWKFFHADFYKIEEWAFYGHPTKQMAKLIVEECKDIPSFNRRLYSTFFFLIKRQQDLSPFVDALLECFADYGVERDQYSLRMFINLLLSNCDKFLRPRLLHLTSTANPIPLTEIVLNQEEASFSQNFTPEAFWILEDKFLFFSYGIDNCKGKSSIINRIFGSNFEQSNDSQFFRGTIDYERDKLFVPARDVVLADGHGRLTDSFKNGVLSIADGVILHTQSDTWNFDLTRIRQEIENAVQYGVKFVVVLVRDVVEYPNRKVLAGFESLDNVVQLGDFEGLLPHSYPSL
jgi:hypothetical protein